MNNKEKNLVWIDLEMTGLNPDSDVILEIATIVTDSQLNILAEGPSIVVHQPESALAMMNGVVAQMHAKSGLTEEVRKSTVSLQEAERQTLEFIKQYCKQGTAPGCGNSVWQDRAFMRRHMQQLDSYLHYRIIDVSTVKELMNRWYRGNPAIMFEKIERHRAMGDVRQSIKELKHYQKNFFLTCW